MTIITLTQEKRLDTVVYEYYGDLLMYDEVISLNTHLLDKLILNLGDEVKLPLKKLPKKELVGESLWD